MFNPNATIIDAFVSHSLEEFQRLFGNTEPAQEQTLEQATRTALETLLNCDCPSHDVQHTILVADVGQCILHGRQLARGDLSSHDWRPGPRVPPTPAPPAHGLSPWLAGLRN